MKKSVVMIFSVALLLAAAVCHGRVFLKWSAGSRGTKAIEAAGGKTVYDAPVKVNGASGQATVLVFDESISRVVAGLGRQFGQNIMKHSGGTMAVGTYRGDGKVMRLVAVEFKRGAQTVVMKLEQSESEAEAAEKPPASAEVAGLPEYPGSTPLFSAENEDTGLAMGVSEAQVEGFEARARIDASLRGDGWKTLKVGGAKTGIMVYQKGTAVCYVFVDRGDTAGTCRITMLHKTLRIK